MIEQSEISRPILQETDVLPLQKYKRKLLTQVVGIFLICLILILERIFYQVIVEAEKQVLATLQQTLGLAKIQAGQVLPAEVASTFLQFYGALSEFSIQFLLLTHSFVTLYTAYDAFLGAKILYVSMGLIYMVSTLQILYSGPRPFWEDRSILCSRCIGSFSHPVLGIILMLFIPCYTYYCSRGFTPAQKIPKHHILCGVFLLLVSFSVQFINFMTGSIYLINIVMGLVVGALFFIVTVVGNQLIQKTIKKTTILKTQSKKYVFYYLLFICALATFVLILFQGQSDFMNINWVQNYLKCRRYLNYFPINYRYNEIIGPWFNLIQTSTLFAWIGAVFGVSVCFRKMPNADWSGGDKRKRMIRAIIANLSIAPSWVFILVIQESGSWVKNIGLNTYLINAIHFFVLYGWLFGLMPYLILYKLCKLTNEENQDLYLIAEQPLPMDEQP